MRDTPDVVRAVLHLTEGLYWGRFQQGIAWEEALQPHSRRGSQGSGEQLVHHQSLAFKTLIGTGIARQRRARAEKQRRERDNERRERREGETDRREKRHRDRRGRVREGQRNRGGREGETGERRDTETEGGGDKRDREGRETETERGEDRQRRRREQRRASAALVQQARLHVRGQRPQREGKGWVGAVETALDQSSDPCGAVPQFPSQESFRPVISL